MVGDLGSHAIDLAVWLNGPIREVTAMTHRFVAGREVEDAGLFLARFENGSLGSFEATRFATGYRIRNLLVTGPDHPYSASFWKPGHIIGYEHTFIAALADFLQALAAGVAFHPDFEDAQRVQLVLDAVERSAASGRWTPVAPRFALD